MAHSVLIVDDSLTVRMDLDQAFRAGGLTPTLAATGAQARAALADQPWDVVVLDVRLPDADGVELLAEIRAEPRHQNTIVLLLSTEAEVQDRVLGLRTGADEYVGKPYDVGYLVSRTRQLLRGPSTPTPEPTTVLVIDDSRTFREHLREALEREGYPVLTAASGEEGLRLAADRRPSAIIVDGVMPGIDGATVIRRVRLDVALRDIPCLLLTADDDDSTELKMLEAGADAFVRKQDDLSVVLAKLATALRHRAGALPISSAGSMHGPTKVLVIDHDGGRRDETVTALQTDGHEVVPATSVADGLSLLGAQPVDCILLDRDLPHLDLAKVIDQTRELPDLQDVPIVVLGDHSDPHALVSCLAAGADHFLARTDGVAILRANVRSQIRRKQSQDRARRIREELLRGELEAIEAQAAKKLAAARAELVAELQWRNEELDAFTGSVTHDLRTPLAVIGGLAEAMLDEDAGALGPRGTHRIERIRAAIFRMSDLVDSLLLLSRASRSELRIEPTDLSALAWDVADELRRRDPDRQVEVEVEPDMVAAGDPGLLRVVLANLVGNSWKFTGVEGAGRITIGSAAQGDETAYFIRDNGVGFAPSDAERIFRPFQRVHKATEFPGTGIGLTTVQRIVERHGGRVWAESEIGRGAVFTFTLPAGPVD